MSYRPYAGIGSRNTPNKILDYFTFIANQLESRGYILRSGGADGADTAFEDGVILNKEIYLPWFGFNDNKSDLFDPPEGAFNIAQEIHPIWGALSRGAQAMHARNCQQVLGERLDSPSLFVICWTSNGLAIGGTRTAILLAERNKIPVLNFGDRKLKIDSREDAWGIVEQRLLGAN